VYPIAFLQTNNSQNGSLTFRQANTNN